jgi:hypothetical protein
VVEVVVVTSTVVCLGVDTSKPDVATVVTVPMIGGGGGGGGDPEPLVLAAEAATPPTTARVATLAPTAHSPARTDRPVAGAGVGPGPDRCLPLDVPNMSSPSAPWCVFR